MVVLNGSALHCNAIAVSFLGFGTDAVQHRSNSKWLERVSLAVACKCQSASNSLLQNVQFKIFENGCP